MTAAELIKYLQRFPLTSQVEIKTPQGSTAAIASVEMAFDTNSISLADQNLSWSEMIQERIKVQLVASPVTVKQEKL